MVIMYSHLFYCDPLWLLQTLFQMIHFELFTQKYTFEINLNVFNNRLNKELILYNPKDNNFKYFGCDHQPFLLILNKRE